MTEQMPFFNSRNDFLRLSASSDMAFLRACSDKCYSSTGCRTEMEHTPEYQFIKESLSELERSLMLNTLFCLEPRSELNTNKNEWQSLQKKFNKEIFREIP